MGWHGMIDLSRLAEYEKRKISAATPAEKFRWFCLKLVEAKYQLGGENIFETDCSGTICWALYCMGINIRLTASGLFDRVFTRDTSLLWWHDKVMAIFYRDAAGKISHVSPVVGRGVILDAVDPSIPVCLKDAETSMEWYTTHDYQTYLREIDWQSAYEIAASPVNGWQNEADEMLKALL